LTLESVFDEQVQLIRSNSQQLEHVSQKLNKIFVLQAFEKDRKTHPHYQQKMIHEREIRIADCMTEFITSFGNEYVEIAEVESVSTDVGTATAEVGAVTTEGEAATAEGEAATAKGESLLLMYY
jgi:hypothetical protein